MTVKSVTTPTASSGREQSGPTGKAAMRRPRGPRVSGGGREARRVAAAVLEVMAGVRTPADAASALGISMPRYYVLEKRALEGLVAACEPRPKGPPRRADRELERLRQEVARLGREAARNQALVRAAGRSIGLAPPARPQRKGKKADAAGHRKRRRRRPVVRALKVVDRLKSEPVTSDGQATAGPGPTGTEGSG